MNHSIADVKPTWSHRLATADLKWSHRRSTKKPSRSHTVDATESLGSHRGASPEPPLSCRAATGRTVKPSRKHQGVLPEHLRAVVEPGRSHRGTASDQRYSAESSTPYFALMLGNNLFVLYVPLGTWYVRTCTPWFHSARIKEQT